MKIQIECRNSWHKIYNVIFGAQNLSDMSKYSRIHLNMYGFMLDTFNQSAFVCFEEILRIEVNDQEIWRLPGW